MTATLCSPRTHAPTHPRSEGIRAQDVQQVVTQFRRRKRLSPELRESGGVLHCDMYMIKRGVHAVWCIEATGSLKSFQPDGVVLGAPIEILFFHLVIDKRWT